MPLKISSSRSIPATVDATVVAVASDRSSDRHLKARGLPLGALKAQGFTGAVDQIAFVSDAGGRSVIVLGIGPLKEIDDNRLRRVGAQAVRAGSRSKRLAVDVLDLIAIRASGDLPRGIRALAEGLVLGSYRFTEYRSDPKPVVLAAVTVAGVSGKAATDAFA